MLLREKENEHAALTSTNTAGCGCLEPRVKLLEQPSYHLQCRQQEDCSNSWAMPNDTAGSSETKLKTKRVKLEQQSHCESQCQQECCAVNETALSAGDGKNFKKEEEGLCDSWCSFPCCEAEKKPLPSPNGPPQATSKMAAGPKSDNVLPHFDSPEFRYLRFSLLRSAFPPTSGFVESFGRYDRNEDPKQEEPSPKKAKTLNKKVVKKAKRHAQIKTLADGKYFGDAKYFFFADINETRDISPTSLLSFLRPKTTQRGTMRRR
uniref:Uncharacterized protein n=1 Tax=Heterosigma akashiwo TaxID=2829 RepID=A0A7S3UQH7_HETAK